jgi:hypothetical protein
MIMVSKMTKITRGAIIGVLAAAAVMMALPGVAAAGHGSRTVKEWLERINVEIKHIGDIQGLYRQDREIGRMQSRLFRLERITQGQYGKRARKNRQSIDHLQRRLRKLERRVEAKIARLEGYRDDRRDWHETTSWGYGRDQDWGYRRSSAVYGGGGWN